MSYNKSPQLEYLPYGGVISTPFIFQNVCIQNAANSVYLQKSTADALYLSSNPIAPKTYIFRTYYERMQYIIGRQGTAKGASGY